MCLFVCLLVLGGGSPSLSSNQVTLLEAPDWQPEILDYHVFGLEYVLSKRLAVNSLSWVVR